MKKIFLLALISWLLLPLAGCQSAEDRLSQLPDTQDVTITIEGLQETITTSKAQRDGFYAMYYNPEDFQYIPGSVTDGAFTDKFVSVYDDETTLVSTYIYVHYEPNCKASEWFAALEPGSEFAPQKSPLSAIVFPTWESDAKPSYLLGDNDLLFLRWTANSLFDVENYCYTSPYQNGTLFILASYPEEAAEDWGTRIDSTIRTLVLAEE